MYSPENKRKKHKKKSPLVIRQTPQFASLPHELVVRCLARVSKAYYPTLSLVCKSFRSLIASPELYQTRSLLKCTENFLYVCLNIHPDPNPRWFTLCRTPIGNMLVPISSPSSPAAKPDSSSRVVVGSDIYEIGGVVNGVPSSRVWVLDCQSHTWHKAPDMLEKRAYPLANVIDGKIYVLGGRKEGYISSSWMEVFDPKTQTWNHVSCPGPEIYNKEFIYNSVVIDGKLYLDTRVSYNPKDGTYEPLDPNLGDKWDLFDFQVINNMLFRYDDYEGVFQWYSTKGRDWRNLKGLKGLPKLPKYNTSVKFAGYCGKMIVFWDKHVTDRYGEIWSRQIWCGEITLEMSNNEEEILGMVVWFDVVLEVPFGSAIVKALVATL